MNDKIQWPLIAKYLSGEGTLQEINEVESWMVADTGNRELIEVLKIAWNTSEPEIQTSDTHCLWQQFSEKADHISGLSQSPINTLQRSPSETERKTFSVFFIQNPVWRYAAVFLMFFLATLYFFTADITTLLGIKSSAALKTVSVENARRERATLSDGTIVTLDAGSQFRYPEKFNGNTREVYLTGEAYFEVTSHPEKPFTVFANQAAIEVLGTKFNVRAWQPEQRVIVTVAEGKVLFYPEQDKSQHSVTLNQGFSSSMRQAGLPTPPRRIDIQKSTGWMNNEVYFEDTPLVEILSQLERWYDVTFETRDSILINDRLTVYLADKPLENHLVLLGELADADFVGKGRHYQLIPR